MIVRFEGQGGPVVVRIQIEGIVSWGYTYSAEEHQFHATGTHSEPNDHALGMPSELHMDVNTWRIATFNSGDQPVEYVITVLWHQDGDVVAKWPEDGPLTGELDPNGSAVHSDHALLVAR